MQSIILTADVEILRRKRAPQDDNLEKTDRRYNKKTAENKKAHSLRVGRNTWDSL
jgi:hypothetical protein